MLRRPPPQESFAARALCWLVVLGAASFHFWRAHFGVDFTDESFYVAMAHRFTLGDVPFRDELAVQQTAAFLYYPLVRLYAALGSYPEGLMLSLRLAFVTYVGGVAWLVFRAGRDLVGAVPASIVAALFAVWVMNPIYNFSYNTLGATLSAAAWFAAVLGLKRQAPSWFLASGACLGLSAVAYLPLMLVLSLCIAAGLWRVQRVGMERSLLAAFLGAASVIVPFALLLLWFGPQDVVLAVVRTNASAQKYGGVDKLKQLTAYLVQQFPLWQAASLLAVRVGVKVFPGARGALTAAFVFATASLAPRFAAGGQLEELARWEGGLVTASMLAGIGLGLGLGGAIRRPLLLVWIPAFCSGLVTAGFATDNPGRFVVGGLSCVLCLALVLFAEADLLATGGTAWPAPLRIGLRALLVMLPVAVLGCATLAAARHTYRDESPARLTFEVRSGPFRGLLTTQAKGELLASLESDLSRLVPSAARVIFYNDFPAGFLLSRRRPAICGVWVYTSPFVNAFRQFYVDCVLQMARDPTYLALLLVNPRDPALPRAAGWWSDDVLNAFLSRCGIGVLEREGLFRISRLDAACVPLR